MENLEKYASERFELNRQKQTLKEQQQQRLSVTYNGGLFYVDMNLMTYLSMRVTNAGLFQQSREDIIPDSYDTPIKIDVQDLLILCDQRWKEVHNDWYNEYEELKTKRKVKDVAV
tara:strand:- start:106 stop:450 length:345 start_codon:yes stop_codon:yes gene_type:complete